MENKLNSFTALACLAITVALVITLAWNGVDALLGHAKFATWHAFGTLPLLSFFTYVQLKENPDAVKWLKRLYRKTRKWLHYHSRTISRAIAAVALFIFRPFNRPQTEP